MGREVGCFIKQALGVPVEQLPMNLELALKEENPEP